MREVEVHPAGPEDIEACFEIRRVVFVVEQGVSREEEFDGADATCAHFVARVDGQPAGTARLVTTESRAKAQRVAVLERYRRLGLGRELMTALEREARQRGLGSVVLHAQTAAIPFYEAIGYTAEGPVFEEAGIPHRVMTKPLVSAPAV